jgi:hypothetical protein
LKFLKIAGVFVFMLLLPKLLNSQEVDHPLPLASRPLLNARQAAFAIPQVQYSEAVQDCILDICRRLSELEKQNCPPLQIVPLHQIDSFDLPWVRVDQEIKFDIFLEDRAAHLQFLMGYMKAQGLLTFEIEDLDDDWLYFHVAPRVPSKTKSLTDF